MGASQVLLSLFFTLLHFSESQGALTGSPKYELTETQDTNTSLYIVYMGHAAPTVQPKVLQGNILLRVLGSAQAAEKSLVYTYDKGFRGFAAMLSTAQAEAIRSVPSVISVFLSRSVKIQTTASYNYLGFSTSDGVWPASNYGENTIVGMLDTGVWPESESFKDDGMSPVPATWKGKCVPAPGFGPAKCNRKLIGARFYYKGYEAITGHVIEKRVFDSPRDTEGHGSHTASTAVGRRVANASFLGLGQGTATGGAPLARLAVYKVCWDGRCSDADILAGMDDAVHDGVNILSMSIGGFYEDYQNDSMAIGAFHAVARGILVVAAGGNNGPDPASVLNIAPWFLTVAASTINRQFNSKVSLGNGESYEGITLNTFTMKAGEMFPLVYGGYVPAKGHSGIDSSSCTCGTLNKTAVKGKIVLCEESWAGSADACVSEAGGVGLITVQVEPQIAFPYSLPTCSVEEEISTSILRYINSTKTPTARIEKSETVFNTTPAPVSAFFSSRGPNMITQEILKPDITAPGVNILAAWSPVAHLTYDRRDHRRANYSIVSGTSMATPHVAGAAAVIRTLHPHWSPAAVKSALMTTATPLDESINAEYLGLSAGSGQVNPASFADPGLVYDITSDDYAKFLCSVGYTTAKLRLVTGDNSECPEVPPQVLDLNYPSIYVTWNKTQSQMVTVTRTVTNVGPANSTYMVSVVSPNGVQIAVTPTILMFDPANNKRSFTVKIKPRKVIVDYVFGSLTWSDGAHSVRIPVGVGPILLGLSGHP